MYIDDTQWTHDVRKFDQDDIFNKDKTGLFYKQ